MVLVQCMCDCVVFCWVYVGLTTVNIKIQNSLGCLCSAIPFSHTVPYPPNCKYVFQLCKFVTSRMLCKINEIKRCVCFKGQLIALSKICLRPTQSVANGLFLIDECYFMVWWCGHTVVCWTVSLSTDILGLWDGIHPKHRTTPPCSRSIPWMTMWLPHHWPQPNHVQGQYWWCPWSHLPLCCRAPSHLDRVVGMGQEDSPA